MEIMLDFTLIKTLLKLNLSERLIENLDFTLMKQKPSKVTLR